jgi:hypothetical protein
LAHGVPKVLNNNDMVAFPMRLYLVAIDLVYWLVDISRIIKRHQWGNIGYLLKGKYKMSGKIITANYTGSAI